MTSATNKTLCAIGVAICGMALVGIDMEMVGDSKLIYKWLMFSLGATQGAALVIWRSLSHGAPDPPPDASDPPMPVKVINPPSDPVETHPNP